MGKQEEDLSSWLADIQLGQYAKSLIDLGATHVSHLRDVEASDIDALGFKGLERKRFERALNDAVAPQSGMCEYPKLLFSQP